MKRILTLAVIGVFIGLVIALSVGCGGESVTGPSGDLGSVGSVGTPSTSTVAPAPAPSPTPVAGTPTGDRPYVTFQPPAGQGEFCNPMSHPLVLKVEYWNANNFAKQILLETREFPAAPKTCVGIPPASEIVKLGCGERVHVQVDAATTEHLGHIFVDLVGPEEKETVTEEVTYGPWSECAPNEKGEGCSKARMKTITTTKTYVCKEKVVEVVQVEEREACTCEVKCIPEEKVDVKVEYSEWGECVADKSGTTYNPGCYQSRVKTTTTTTTYAKCENKEPKIEVKQETEKRECECKVQCEVAREQVITYCIPLLGNPTEELAYINGLGLGYTFKFSTKYEDVDSPWLAPKDFDAVLLKSGSCDLPNTGVKPAPQKGTEYRLYLGVDKGDSLAMSSGKDISHASVFTLDCDR